MFEHLVHLGDDDARFEGSRLHDGGRVFGVGPGVEVARGIGLRRGDQRDVQARREALLGLLKSDDSHNRFYAACALGEMGARQALSDLLAALKDETGGQVREGAAMGLEALGDELARARIAYRESRERTDRLVGEGIVHE